MFKNITIKQKFYLMLTGLTLTLVIIVALVYGMLSPVQTNWHTYVGSIASRHALLSRMQGDIGSIDAHFQRYLIAGSKGDADGVREAIAELGNSVVAYRRLGLEGDETALLEALTRLTTEYSDNLATVAKLRADGTPAVDIATRVSLPDPAVANQLDGLSRSVDRRGQALARQIDQGFGDTLWSLLVVALLALVSGGLVFALVSRSIVRTLCGMQRKMLEIEQTNDLTVRLDAGSSDELGDTAKAINSMLDKFSTITRQVRSSATRLLSEVETMAQISLQTKDSMEQQRAETDTAASAMTEMSATVQQVAKGADDAARAANQAHEEAVSGKNVVAETIDSINALAGEVEQAAQVIQRLDADSNDIGMVIDVIRDIAEQTNLLALNAAIEAARAGDQGRGFAVVADEVRTLASRTQKSTAEIQEMIERLQRAAAEAVQVMEEGRQEAETSVSRAAKAGTSLEVIDRAVATITDMNHQIASSAEQQSSVTDDMHRNIVRITEMASGTLEGALETAGTSEKTVRQVQGLRLMVEQFKVKENRVLDLSSYKAGHLAWRPQLSDFLAGARELTEEHIATEHDCALGKWYDSEGKSRFGHLAPMKAFDQLHIAFHRSVNQTIQKKLAGDSQQAKKNYSEVEQLAGRLSELLDSIEEAAEGQG